MIDTIIDKLLTLPGIIIGLSLHEFAHAFVSAKLGDPTPVRQGRVTLNPLAHIDWIGFAALLLLGFGWGRPVEINPAYYKKRRRDELLVGIAGVTMNLIVAVIFSFLVKAVLKAFYATGGSAVLEYLYYILVYTVVINVVLMIFNLIPCPPLDGWGIVTQIFKLDRHEWWYKVQQYGSYILIALLITDAVDLILTPLVNLVVGLLGLM